MKKFLFMVLSISLIMSITMNVHADAGPKPSISIRCENVPYDFCYIDILTENAFFSSDDPYHEEKYDREYINGSLRRISGAG